MLTPDKAREYLNSDGVNCPYCGSTDITGRALDMEAGVVTQTIDCASCNEQWNDIYTLVGIADADGNRIETIGIIPLACPFTNNRLCDWRCPIWDKGESRCSLLSIAINTKRI